MQGFARMLLEEHSKDLNTEAQSYLRRIASSASRMDALIQDVLNYTRVLRADTQLMPVDLDRLVRDLVATYPGWRPPTAEIQIEVNQETFTLKAYGSASVVYVERKGKKLGYSFEQRGRLVGQPVVIQLKDDRLGLLEAARLPQLLRFRGDGTEGKHSKH
jgi:light-regulated signal transduction histidine kinase (bacteriophytochrome)